MILPDYSEDVLGKHSLPWILSRILRLSDDILDDPSATSSVYDKPHSPKRANSSSPDLAHIGVLWHPGFDVDTDKLNDVYAGDDAQVHRSSSIAMAQENDPSRETDQAPNDEDGREREGSCRCNGIDEEVRRLRAALLTHWTG